MQCAFARPPFGVPRGYFIEIVDQEGNQAGARIQDSNLEDDAPRVSQDSNSRQADPGDQELRAGPEGSPVHSPTVTVECDIGRPNPTFSVRL